MPSIAIDVSPLHDGNSVRGVGHYTSHLVDYLQKEIKNNSDYKDFDIKLVTRPDQLHQSSFDLVHYPYFDPFKLTLPFYQKIPYIITIHDLIPLEYKSHFPVGIKGNIKWLIQKYLARKSKFILTVSHSSKFAISKILNYPHEYIYPTYLAADEIFKPITDLKLLKKIQEKYKLPTKFVLYVGDINWNKNVPALVKACLKNKLPLVIVGASATNPAPDHPWTKDILWLQHQSKALIDHSSKALTLTGFVPDSDLAAIFNLATIYCQPSYAEGFGLPLVQAMQSGCPVVYADRGAMAEIMDYNGRMFNPEKDTSLSLALKQLWDNSDIRRDYSQKGLKRSQNFHWRFTALQTLSVYKLALMGNEKH